MVVDGEVARLLPLDFFSFPFFTVLSNRNAAVSARCSRRVAKAQGKRLQYSVDFVAGAGLVARVTDGERRRGRLRDLEQNDGENHTQKGKSKRAAAFESEGDTCLDRLDDEEDLERERLDRDELGETKAFEI